MTKTVRYAVLTAAVVALAGCADRPMNQLGNVSASGSGFDSALAKEYMGLSEAEKQAGDNRNADAYARRAMDAAAGNPTEPDSPEYREPIFPDEYKPELMSERQRLMSALGRTGRQKAPADAARAQAMYDCWVEQRQENFQEEHIQACREAYMTAIGRVEAALATGAAPDAYLAFFDFDKSNLTPEAQEIVRTVVEQAKSQNYNMISATGYTDTSGPADYNMGLSKRRAESVANAMTSMGVPRDKLKTDYKGEQNPLVPTGDGVREPQNRRVEMQIKK